ncbi:hypothetical protein K1719_003423 [Acacia pycnantha]|nr:hypothetical protein K1719_003423 [Acacia pycnantha]
MSLKKWLFGNVHAEVYTIEFQKRSLPHAHILIWLTKRDKIKEPDDVDKIVSAEIPYPDFDPQLYELVQKYMMHSPCGPLNPKAQCMMDKKCNKFFPKKYNPHTIVDHEGFPTYMRREDVRSVDIKGIALDNRFPPVERLSFHLPNQQYVIYSNTDDVAGILAMPRVSRLTHAAPSSGEFYYLRILLTKAKGPSSYDAIRTVDGVAYPTYLATCIALGLLDDDCKFIAALKEASIWAIGRSLRTMFELGKLFCGTRLPHYFVPKVKLCSLLRLAVLQPHCYSLERRHIQGLPLHILILKVGIPIMLLRNIDQAAGLCNGTRLRVTHLGNNVIEGLTLNGSNPHQKVLIHRMDMNPSDNSLPFQMKRR